MKKLLFSLWLIAVLFIACSPTKSNLAKPTNAPINQTLVDKDGETQLIGLCNEAGLKTAPYQEWYNKNYEKFQPNTEILAKCKGKTKDIEVLAFMGTWCGDSKREVPRFYKAMDEIGVPSSQIKLVNLDAAIEHYKQSPTGEEKGLNIHRVPTFIFYQAGKEIGRIVESPITSMETDITQILNGLATKERYAVVANLQGRFDKGELEMVREKYTPWGKYAARNTTSTSELNTYGYVLMARNDLEEAITVFTINTLAYPKNANTFDSLGEAYLAIGNKNLAKENYKKAMEIDPELESAKLALQEMIK